MRQQILDELDEVMNGDNGEEEAYQEQVSEWVSILLNAYSDVLTNIICQNNRPLSFFR